MGLNFIGAVTKSSSLEKVVIIPVSYGRTVTYKKGTEDAPLAILRASQNLELFDEELGKEIYTIGIRTSPILKLNHLSPRAMLKKVEHITGDTFAKGRLPVLLGGEHLISVGAVSAAKQYFKDLSVLYFDAHYDLRDTYNGTRYNHACTARRIIEVSPVVEIGVRSLDKEERDLSLENLKIINMLEIRKGQGWIESVRSFLTSNVYISIDLDVFDPSIIPSLGTPEPGGFGWYDFLESFRRLIAGKNIVGLDVVEFCPIKGMIAPDFTVAKLIYKILGYIFFT